jgi:hypothetical protein
MITDDKGRVFDIRQATKADIPYITQSWLYTYEESPEMDMPGFVRDNYFGYEHKRLDHLIPRASRAGSMYICHVGGAPHLIRGYLCAEAFEAFPVVHWLQVKKKFQREGVATALLTQFYQDFEITPGNLVYTYSCKDLRRFPHLTKKAVDRYNLVYLPQLKYTTMPAHWEV